MQYDLDLKSEHAKNFRKIRKILLSYPNIKEVKNAKQTSYSDEYGMIVMMRSKKDVLVVAFGKGAKLEDKFPNLQGNGKIVRHLYFKTDDKIDASTLKAIIEESFILGMEAYELKLLRSNISENSL